MLEFKKIREAHERIKPHVRKTQLRISDEISRRIGVESFIKFENEQITGSFKIRGAFNKVLSFPEEDKQKTLVVSSSGNHAQAVAYVGKILKKKVKVVMPEISPLIKINATKALGAEVILHGKVYDEAFQEALKVNEKEKGVFIHPFDDEDVMAGQGSLGVEIFEKIKDLDSLIVPIGGGGLISGIAVALHHLNPSCRIYGVVSKSYSSMRSLFKGERKGKKGTFRTLADGIAVSEPNKKIYENYVQPFVEDIVDLAEGPIAESILFLLEKEKTVAEGSSALCLAAALRFKKWGWDLGKKTCLLLSGGNIDLNLLSRAIQKGLFSMGRIRWFSVVVVDEPGLLSHLSQIVSKASGNILEVQHDSYFSGLDFDQIKVNFLVEIRDEEQFEFLKESLKKAGFFVSSGEGNGEFDHN